MVVPSRVLGQPNRERWAISLGDWSRLGHCWRDSKCVRYHAASIRYCFKGDGHSNIDLCDSCWEVVLMNFLLVLSPQYGPAEFGDYTTVSVSGGVLTVEGRDYAFSDLADGAELTMEDFADPYPVYQVRRRGDTISVWIIYRYPAGATHAARYPEPVPVPGDFDGPVDLPR
ncbi:hypothetical protein X778_34560 [Pseudomonas aeruginosa VRFPA07]|nr:hypothetical protein X778_34560 [Pseudomonas aeruginosa VRFPA07]WAK43849.1 hypothetical protein zjk6_51 [Pseudomonas phage zjk6]DBA08412.1 TPA_asm: hypothetical protein [Pseudomonas phage vB_PaeS-D14E]